MADADSIVKSAVSGVAAALFGFISAVAVFRSRFAVIDNQRSADKEQVKQQREHDKELLRLQLGNIRAVIGGIERRQLASLDILVNIANKLGVTGRAVGADVLASLLSTHSVEDEPKD